MARIEIDTKEDSLEELEEVLGIIRAAIDRRKCSVPEKTQSSAQELVKEAAIETPFFKISFQDEDNTGHQPTVNELLEQDSITEDELTELFEHAPEAKAEKKDKTEDEGDSFIEIVEIDEEDD